MIYLQGWDWIKLNQILQFLISVKFDGLAPHSLHPVPITKQSGIAVSEDVNKKSFFFSHGNQVLHPILIGQGIKYPKRAEIQTGGHLQAQPRSTSLPKDWKNRMRTIE